MEVSADRKAMHIEHGQHPRQVAQWSWVGTDAVRCDCLIHPGGQCKVYLTGVEWWGQVDAEMKEWTQLAASYDEMQPHLSKQHHRKSGKAVEARVRELARLFKVERAMEKKPKSRRPP